MKNSRRPKKLKVNGHDPDSRLCFRKKSIFETNWYLVHFDPAMVVMGAVITAITLLLVIIQHPGARDMLYLLTGIILYGTINVAGEAIQKGLQSITLYNGLLLAATLLLTRIIWKNKGILMDRDSRES